MNEEYIKNYLGQFWDSRERLEVIRYAELYHQITEDYDQKYCSYKDEDGIAWPVDGREMGLINQHAKEVKEFLWENYVSQLGCTAYEWNRTISDVAMHFRRNRA